MYSFLIKICSQIILNLDIFDFNIQLNSPKENYYFIQE